MKELLFGWAIKGQYEVSLLDNIIFFVELWLGLTIVLIIRDFIKNRKKENKNGRRN